MASHRFLHSCSIVTRLSKLSLTRDPPVQAGMIFSSIQRPARFFSGEDGSGKPPVGNTAGSSSKVAKGGATDSDPFGVNFEDGDQGLGPDLPPIYKRDATTGRLTGEIKQEISEEQKRILNADPIEKERLLLGRLEKRWQGDEAAELHNLGQRVRRSEMGLNVLGRSAKSQLEKSDEDSDVSDLGEAFSKYLTPSEFETLSKFAEINYKKQLDEEDIPVSSGSKRTEDDPDSTDLSLKWLTARAQRQMDDSIDDNPYSDLAPSDLSPSRLVNRKRAKIIHPRLLHHNNIPLLKRYLTPTGQIQNRVQTRLGARDQRRVSKLIKRARTMGLVPYVGQFKSETHGWIYEQDINEERAWEKELKRRGLVIKQNSKKE